jgi:PrtD family type I secretion system ABC transporter
LAAPKVAAHSKSDELGAALKACRAYFVTAAVFSLAINILYLGPSLYMLQVYDRVVPSASQVTLLMLTLVLIVALTALAGLDSVRARVLTRASVRLDRLIAGRVITAVIERAGIFGGARSQLLRDFDAFRQYITGPGIHAAFDLPWTPIYILVIFALHPWLGLFALLSAVILTGMALVNEWMVRPPLTEANEAAARNYSFTEMSLRNWEVVQAMGMMDGLLRRWGRDRGRMLDRQAVASDRAATMQSLIRFLRLSMQSVILGLGAYLVIERLTTPGAMFAANILLGRALQPVEQMVGSWRNLVSSRSAYRRVRDLLALAPVSRTALELPRPAGRLVAENLTYVPPGRNRPVLRGISFRLEAGEMLGVIGPSGAGKSTLVRQLVGVMTPTAGAVRLDGADVAAWPREQLGHHLGYLPQDIELFADTVAANISRFQSGDDGKIIEAAKLAGVHEMILRLSNGYETQVGEGGTMLSGGYRQRIGLARAVYDDPSLVVLDEPSSNLDQEGDAALADCLVQLKQRGVTVIIVSHRPATIGIVDKILVIRDGVAEMFGTRAEILAKLTRPVAVSSIAASGASA